MNNQKAILLFIFVIFLKSIESDPVDKENNPGDIENNPVDKENNPGDIENNPVDKENNPVDIENKPVDKEGNDENIESSDLNTDSDKTKPVKITANVDYFLDIDQIAEFECFVTKEVKKFKYNSVCGARTEDLIPLVDNTTKFTCTDEYSEQAEFGSYFITHKLEKYAQVTKPFLCGETFDGTNARVFCKILDVPECKL